MHGSEQHFRSTLGSPRAGVLLDALRKASAAARKIAVSNTFVEGRTEPTVAFDLAVQELAKFHLEGGVRHEVVKNQHLWVIDDTYGLRVKKLRSGYLSSNHVSKQQDQIAAFDTLDGLEPLIYVTAGIRYSDLTGLPEECVVVKYQLTRRRRQWPEWIVNLEHLAAGGADSVATIPVLPMPAAPAAEIRVRNTKSPDEARRTNE